MIRGRVEAARAIQRKRLAPYGLHANAAMATRHIREFCPVDEAGQKLLEMVVDKLGMSARSYSRILKVARTIADLAGEANIKQVHLAEAIQYRGMDRKVGVDLGERRRRMSPTNTYLRLTNQPFDMFY
ncbi:MAG: GTP-binding protein EngB [Desulfuromusa sp.]|nr:GTP-binding protein EngB [Desulfuromusa sp.]